MNLLTSEQEDALIEVVNVGISKSAKVLSNLLKQAVKVSIPEIQLLDLNQIPLEDIFNYQNAISYVYQHLSGGIKGCIFLVYQDKQIDIFMSPILEKARQADANVELIEREGMLEVGNILVSSLLSGMVNMLKTNVSIGAPLYGHTSVELLSKHLAKRSALENHGESKIFIFQAVLDTVVQEENISLDIILSMDSIDDIISSVDKLLGH